jgi:hypothetical protein
LVRAEAGTAGGEHYLGGKNDRCGWGEVREKNYYTGEPNLSCDDSKVRPPKVVDKNGQPTNTDTGTKPTDTGTKPKELCLQILWSDVRFEKDGVNCGTREIPAALEDICCTLRQYEVVLVRPDSNTNDKFHKVKVRCPGQDEAAEGRISKYRYIPNENQNEESIKRENVRSFVCNSF